MIFPVFFTSRPTLLYDFEKEIGGIAKVNILKLIDTNSRLSAPKCYIESGLLFFSETFRIHLLSPYPEKLSSVLRALLFACVCLIL